MNDGLRLAEEERPTKIPEDCLSPEELQELHLLYEREEKRGRGKTKRGEELE